MSVHDAIAILKLHREGGTRRSGWRIAPRPLEEMRESILKKLSAIERARASRAP
jgi:hypothetical protein